jgi:hypothetical protein
MVTWMVVVLVVVVLGALAWWTSGPRFNKGLAEKRVDGTDISRFENRYRTGGDGGWMG